MKAAIIQFIDFEHEGSLQPALNQFGYTVNRYFASTDDLTKLTKNNDELDLLIILGGPIGVYEHDDYPYLATITNLIKTRLERKQAMIGVCLGCQLIAHAAGAKVFPGGQKEIGWSRLKIHDRANNLLKPFTDVPVLHWHGDTFDLPEDATLLASSDIYPNQAFLLGHNVLGLQFHLEVTEPHLERWYIGHANEIASLEDTTVKHLRNDGKQYAQRLETAASSFWSDYLQEIN